MVFLVSDLAPLIGSQIQSDKGTLLSGENSADIKALLEARSVLVVRGANLDDTELLAFAETLGPVRVGTVIREGKEGHGGILQVSFDKDVNPDSYEGYLGTFSWHMDGPYDALPPWATLLTPRVLSPTGGQTEFSNTYAAYAALSDDEKARLANVTLVHTVAAANRFNTNPSPQMAENWLKFPHRERPIVWEHMSGRKSLVIGASADHVVGMDRDNSDELLQRLTDWCTQPQFVYRHEWQMGDIVIWDNTGALHRVLPFDMDSGRRLHRVTLEGREA